MTTAERPSLTRDQRRITIKNWNKLGLKRRREVIRLSKRGQLHPDPDVAQTAYLWALAWIPAEKSKQASVSVRAIWVVIGLVVAVALGDGPEVVTWNNRRLARRIVALTEQAGRHTVAAGGQDSPADAGES